MLVLKFTVSFWLFCGVFHYLLDMPVCVCVCVCVRVCAMGMYEYVWGGISVPLTIVMVLGWGRDLKQYQNARQIIKMVSYS